VELAKAHWVELHALLGARGVCPLGSPLPVWGDGGWLSFSEGNIMQHVRSTIEQLRRYIATCEDRNDLQEVDTLLAVALDEVRRKLQQKQNRDRKSVEARNADR
jgi:hypothetical protein